MFKRECPTRAALQIALERCGRRRLFKIMKAQEPPRFVLGCVRRLAGIVGCEALWNVGAKAGIELRWVFEALQDVDVIQTP
jgi:hypothetical protein